MSTVVATPVESIPWWVMQDTTGGVPNTFQSGRINLGGYNRVRGIITTGVPTTELLPTLVQYAWDPNTGICNVVCAAEIPLDTVCSGNGMNPGNSYCYDIVLLAPYVQLFIEETAGPGGDTITWNNEAFLT